MSTKSSATPDYTGHRARLRERFMKEPRAVPDYEVLEMLLHLVIPRKDTKPLAKALLEHFGNIRGIACARDLELKKVPECGSSVIFLRTLIQEVVARYHEEALIREIYDVDVMMKALMSRFSGCSHEELWVAVMNHHERRILNWLPVAKGFDSTVACPQRDIIRVVLNNEGDAFVLVHNHPSGHPMPSLADQVFTSSLYKTCARLGIKLVEHIIVGGGCCYSMLLKNIDGKPPKRI